MDKKLTGEEEKFNNKQRQQSRASRCEGHRDIVNIVSYNLLSWSFVLISRHPTIFHNAH